MTISQTCVLSFGRENINGACKILQDQVSPLKKNERRIKVTTTGHGIWFYRITCVARNVAKPKKHWQLLCYHLIPLSANRNKGLSNHFKHAPQTRERSPSPARAQIL
jgi:hypothetical protein